MFPELAPLQAERALVSALVFWRPAFLWAALGTALIETPLFALLGYRRLREWLCFAGINVVSNLLLNETLSELPSSIDLTPALALGELLVLLLEFTLCLRVVSGSGLRLFAALTITNLTSLLCGLALFGMP